MILSLLAPPAAAAPEVHPAWWLYFGIAAVILVGGGVVLAMSLRKKEAETPCPKCGKLMMPDWPRCMFCKAPRGLKAAQVEIVAGPKQGQVINLELDVTSFGSAPTSTVALGVDKGVSRKHAGIRKIEGGYEIADFGSTNGTYVNGQKMPKRHLEIGDVIRIGSTEMLFKG